MKVEFDYHRKQIKSKNEELMLLLWVLMSVEYNIFLSYVLWTERCWAGSKCLYFPMNVCIYKGFISSWLELIHLVF